MLCGAVQQTSHLRHMATVIAFPKTTNWEPELSKRQLANRLGFSTRWVELMVRDEGLPTHRLRGNQRRFLLSEVDAWFENRRQRR